MLSLRSSRRTPDHARTSADSERSSRASMMRRDPVLAWMKRPPPMYTPTWVTRPPPAEGEDVAGEKAAHLARHRLPHARLLGRGAGEAHVHAAHHVLEEAAAVEAAVGAGTAPGVAHPELPPGERHQRVALRVAGAGRLGTGSRLAAKQVLAESRKALLRRCGAREGQTQSKGEECDAAVSTQDGTGEREWKRIGARTRSPGGIPCSTGMAAAAPKRIRLGC